MTRQDGLIDEGRDARGGIVDIGDLDGKNR